MRAVSPLLAVLVGHARRWCSSGLLPLACLLAISPVYGEEQPGGEEQPSAEPLSYSRDIQPIFARHCVGCHQGAKQLGGYVMVDHERLIAGGETGEAAIVPGDPDASFLVTQITPVDGVAEMPQKAAPLSEVEIERIRRWIAEGAVDDSPPASGPKYSADNPPVYRQAPSITSVDASPDGSLLAVAGFHEVLLVHPSDGSLAGRLVGISERIESVRFSPDGTRLAVAGGDPGLSGEIQIWKLDDRTLQLSAPFTHDTLRGISWSPDGNQVAFGATDNALRAIDAETGEQRLFQGAHEDWVLGTTFTSNGGHVVSVARDMSCKLTEVATQRFIDNITSITPGALRGGLTSVVTIPGREEILVGGADGVAKVYGVFRTSARKIGDDANLIRELPALEGRIFSVDVNPDGTRLAAASTIDGRTEVRVWKGRDQAVMPEDIKAIQAKQPSERNEEERNKWAAFVTPADEQLARLVVDDTAVYAICFVGSDELAIAGADGQIRMLDAAGNLARTFAPAPVTEEEADARLAAYDPAAWHAQQISAAADASAAPPSAAPEPTVPLDTVVGIRLSPSDAVSFASPYEYVQLLVTAELGDGAMADVTRQARFEASPAVSISPTGLMRPLASGEASVLVSIGQHQAKLSVHSDLPADRGQAEVIDFVRDVNPVLSRLGCNQGTCHGAQKGKNGFKLSLRGYDPLFDVRALTDDLAARRINLASPDDSLMLLKTLGRVPHQGGGVVEAGSPYHGILRSWIAQGAKLDLSTQKAVGIEIEPHNPVTSIPGSTQQIRVVATYADGARRDVTREAYVSSGNTEVASVSGTGLLTAVRRGEAPILARYEGSYAASTLTVMGQRSGFQWQPVETYSPIDQLVAEKWQRMKIEPSELCDDATFLRRVTLDLTGLPPTADQVREFLADHRDTRIKRAELVDTLIGSPAFVQYWTNKWADLLQVNRKFLGAEGAASFRGWIEAAIRENQPYDEFAHQILASSGSNKENPPASYYKILRTPEDTMENTTHLFLGIRFNCNKCHDHPFERWTQDQYYQTAAFFAQTHLRPDPAAGAATIGGTAVEGAKPLYEEVYDSAEGSITHPRNGQAVEPVFPYACEFEAGDDATPRQKLAAWITSDDNQYFARSYVNRLWGYLLGVGLIEPIDDIRAGNPPTNPELLDYLTAEFVRSGFNVQHVMRSICNSRTYQLAVATNQWNEDDRTNYSHAMPRRLPAEVLYDAIHFVTGSTSHIPGVPAGTRAASLPDAGLGTEDGFLANLGRPVRESACECERSSDLQLGPIMALVSGPTVGSAISDNTNDLHSLVQQLQDDGALVEALFLKILNRLPQPAEVEAFRTMMEEIDDDHAALVARLAEREAWWAEQLPKLQAEQAAAIAAAGEELTSLQASLKPERDRLEAERAARIAAAQTELETVQQGLSAGIDKWQAELAGADWYPLRPSALASSQGTVLRTLEDRSVRADGSKDKGVYEVTVDSRLGGITGFRLEALPVEGLAGGGPGFPPNGNFVVTEFEVFAAPLSDPSAQVPLKIAAGKADFTQASFAIEQAFDGNKEDQLGWAVSPAGATVHWATFQLAEPVQHEGGTRLTFKIHQVHNAEEHRLARFRLSATSVAGPLPLGVPEAFASVLQIPAEQRTEAELKPLLDHLAKTDPAIIAARAALGAAQAAVPENPQVTAMKRRIDELSKPIPTDATLLGLRNDLEQSQQQLQNVRLTAAEDLTWALVNSPAFLFNR